MNPTEDSISFEPSSFRDRDSRVFRHQGGIYRALNTRAQQDWERLRDSRFFSRWQDNGEMVETTECSPPIPLQEPWTQVLSHQTIPFVSYPHEWCFGMLRDAALQQLRLNLDALKDALISKDGSAYNTQWRGCRPVFIDTGSLTQLQPGAVWMGYRQFCQMFLYPLMIQAYRQTDFQSFFRGHIDGIPVATARALLGRADRFKRGVFTHVFLQSKLQHKLGASDRKVTTDVKKAGFSKQLIENNLRGLHKLISKLSWGPQSSEWSDYTQQHNYSAESEQEKTAFVSAVAERQQPALVWDLGANTGRYSALVAAHSGYVIAADIDHLAVQRHYQQLRQNGPENILPLVFNLADPSPRLGWRLRERNALEDRGKPDLILALALIHHLVIGANLPMQQVIAWFASLGANLIIEFVEREDGMVKRLLTNREDLFHDYHRAPFEASLSQFFTKVESQPLSGGTRVLYHCTHPDRD